MPSEFYSGADGKTERMKLGLLFRLQDVLLLMATLLLLHSTDSFIPSKEKSLVRCKVRSRCALHQKQAVIPFGEEWARQRGMEPGYGGIWPGSFFSYVNFICNVTACTLLSTNLHLLHGITGDPNAPKFNVRVRSKKTGEEFEVKVPADRYIFFYFEEKGNCFSILLPF